MKTLLSALMLMISISLIAQTPAPEYGKVTLDELMLQSYPQDPQAEAVILYDIGSSRFQDTDNGFNLRFERRMKLKIFNKAGFKYAEFKIPFYREGSIYERVEIIEAITYNISEQGYVKKTPLDIKNSYDEKVSETWNVKKFAMPDVKEGTVIELKYALTSQYIFNLQDWEFQSTIPTLYSEYEVRIIPFYEYIFLMQGASKFDKKESYEDKGFSRQFGSVNYNDMVYKFAMKDVPAFKDEQFISSYKDYIMKLDFQLAVVHRLNGSKTEIMTTWPKMCNDLIKNPEFGRYINASENAADKLLDQQALVGKTDKEKLEYIINYIKANYTWNGEDRKYTSKNLNQFLKEKTGNSANINLLLVGLLKASGIEAEPLLISNRDNGKIAVNYPFHHFFNNVIAIVKVGEKFLLADATEQACPYDMIPKRCINEKGLIVKKDSDQWAELRSNVPSVTNKSFKINPQLEKDSVECVYSIRSSGYDAIKYRTTWGDMPEKVISALQETGLVCRDSLHIINFTNTSKPYELNAKVSTPMQMLNNRIYVAPFLNEPLAENPLKFESRTYPIDMVNTQRMVFSSDVVIPQGYKILQAPASFKKSDDLVDIIYNVYTNEGSVQVSGTYSFKKATYSAVEYSKLKSHYDDIIRVFNSKIAFEKI